MTFWDHLDELRSVLLKSLAAWLVCAIAAFFAKDILFAWLFAPTSSDFVLYRALCRMAETTGWSALCPRDVQVSFLNTELTAQFMTHVEVSLWAGFILALPLIVYWLYGFVAPGLYEQEKRYSIVLVVCATGLFMLGVLLDYFLIFPLSFRFLSTYQVTDLVVNQINLSSYISLFIVLALLMGLLFEVPVVTWFLSKMGILNASHLRKGRKYVFVAILIIAAVITPTGDPFTLLLVTLPIYGLYEMSIWLCK
ncbi:MAG: twin-arginine translocase subunit TatC [Paludibacteraceae bacterium]|nr:twin-arginine translocase subunit TatC [Paludibacteraceae bacterium]